MLCPWLRLCLPQPLGSGVALKVSPLLFGGRVSSGLLAGGTVIPGGSSGSAVSPAGPAQQAHGAASALCCGHSRVSESLCAKQRCRGRAFLRLPQGSEQDLQPVWPCLHTLFPIQLPPASTVRSGCQARALTGPLFSFLHQSLLSRKSAELGQGDLNSVWSRWKQVPGCGQVEGALSRQRLGMAS